MAQQFRLVNDDNLPRFMVILLDYYGIDMGLLWDNLWDSLWNYQTVIISEL